MPTYEYRCVSCEHQFERFQRMSDDPVKECEVCGDPVRRLLFPVAIHFKGSGFYSTDYGQRNSRVAAGGGASNPSGPTADSCVDQSSESSSERRSPDSSDAAGDRSVTKPADSAPVAAGAGASAAKTG